MFSRYNGKRGGVRPIQAGARMCKDTNEDSHKSCFRMLTLGRDLAIYRVVASKMMS